MGLYFSLFKPLFIIIFFAIYFFIGTDSVFSTFHGTCDFVRFGTVAYCGQTGSVCGPSNFVDSGCDKVDGNYGKTGNQCCSDLRYDYCDGTTFIGGFCGPGDAINMTVTWKCCRNPTPTSTPIPTPTPTTPPPSCSSTSILSISCPASVETGAGFTISYTYKDSGLNSPYKYEYTWVDRADVGYIIPIDFS